VHAIELNGRLCRPDGKPALAGPHDLLFRVHPAQEAESTLWEEVHHDVRVTTGGHYAVVLGLVNALGPHLFDGTPRYVSVRAARAGRSSPEVGDRMPILGSAVLLGEGVAEVAARLGALEARSASAPEREGLIRRRVVGLRRRLRRLEVGAGPLAVLRARLELLEARAERLDGPEGRILRIEDEIEDLVGPDGDVVDLNERMEELHARIAATSTAPPEEGGWSQVFRVATPVDPGDVVCATDREGTVARSEAAYDRRVVGIVATAAANGHARVVLQGTSRCRVDAASGPVRVGDLLTSSEVPGHARVASDRDRSLGAVVGKALGAHRDGRGEIPVLVMIR
jgi:hypothetical protein